MAWAVVEKFRWPILGVKSVPNDAFGWMRRKGSAYSVSKIHSAKPKRVQPNDVQSKTVVHAEAIKTAPTVSIAKDRAWGVWNA